MEAQNKTLPDWQQGEQSKTRPLERVELMQEWLLANKLDILNNIKKVVEDEPVVGFPED